MSWDTSRQQTIQSINLHVLTWALNYAPVDISALILSYSAGWSHCLLLDLLWQFQKWTPFEVQHRRSPKNRQWTWSDIRLRQKMPRHIASNIADNIYWSVVTKCSISYDGRNTIPEVLWKICYHPLPSGLFSDGDSIYWLADFCQTAYGALTLQKNEETSNDTSLMWVCEVWVVEDEICITQLVVRSNAAESRHMKKFFAHNIPKIKGVCTPAVLRETISEVDAWYNFNCIMC